MSRIGSRLRADLGIDTLSTEESASVRATLPSSTEAIRLYAQGLEQYRLSDTVAARDLLVRAVAADPSNAVARSALAAAWSTLGYDAQARDEGRRAAELAASLPREQRLPIEARARALAGDSKSAIDSYRELWRLFPDNLDYGLALVDAQTAAARRRRRSPRSRSLRKLPPPWGDDPRVDLADATANASLGNFAAAHATAMTAAQKAAERGAALLVGRCAPARRRRAVASGRYPEALAACAEAQRLAREAGDRNLEALATVIVGNVYYAEIDWRARKDAYERALAMFRAIGRQASIAGTLNNIANIEHRQGNYDAAGARVRGNARPSRATWAERKMRSWRSTIWAYLMADRGDLPGAIARHQANAGRVS